MRIGLKSKHMKALNPEFWPQRIAIQELLLAQISQEVFNRTLKFVRTLRIKIKILSETYLNIERSVQFFKHIAFLLVPEGFQDLINQNNYDSNWRK